MKQFKQKTKRIRLIHGDSYLGVKVFGLFVYLSKTKLKRNNNNKSPRVRFRRALFDDRGHRCELCGKELPESMLTVHHIKKRAEHPELRYDKENVQLLCLECHRNLHRMEDLMTGVTYSGKEKQLQTI